MARGEDTGHHPHRKVDRSRFNTPDQRLDDFDEYAVTRAGITPQSSLFDIEDAATKFVDDHLGYEGEHRDRLIDNLIRDYHGHEEY